MSDEHVPAGHDPATSKVGRFIQTYSSFLSSFVIGVAGLVATSIWQYRQSQTAIRQAESEQKIAATKAENEWRIARAEILAKNLGVLSTQGANTADARFGVLLSLTRGAILDPELAVSYALELGKDNARYMHDVLAATAHKNYEQLSQAYVPTCLERYGVERDAEICRGDKMADRSHAIADLIHEEMDALDTQPDPQAAAQGPIGLLRNEREVQSQVLKLAWLFEPYLQDLYEKGQWKEIQRFESYSPGARLVAAVVLATSRTGELVGHAQSAELERFHAEHRKWLSDFLLGKLCDPDCRGRLIELMLSVYGESDGDYDETIRRLLLLPRAESGPALAKLHGRLLWCQVDKDDQELFRDRVLVPTLAEAMARPSDPASVQALLELLAMTDEPKQAPALDAWNGIMASLQRHQQDHAFAKRRAAIVRERSNPPAMVKKANFCGAGEASANDAAQGG